MRNRIFALLLSLAMAAATALPAFSEEPAGSATPETAVPLPALAAQPTPEMDQPATPEDAVSGEATAEIFAAADGTCGPDLRWSYADGTLNISGTGPMNDYTAGASPWQSYRDQIRTLNIADGITTIGVAAFWGCTALQNVTTPASLKEMHFAAFAYCSGVKSINIAAGNIGESAFIACSALETVTIGSSVTAMGISAFESCDAIKGVYISDLAAWCRITFGSLYSNPLQYAHRLYLNGAELTSLNLPNGLTEVKDYAFINASNIGSANIPASVTAIGDFAFYGNTGLTTVTLAPSGLQRIGANAFDSCISLRNISLPNSLSYIGSFAFIWSHIGTVNLQQGVIGQYAFKACWVDQVNLGSGVTSIGEGAFAGDNNGGCNEIKNINYGGSRAQWDAMPIGKGNEKLLNAPGITCTGSGAPNFAVVGEGVCKGATVRFGKYEQDNNQNNGAEALDWTVLDVKDGKALVISKYVLAFGRYDENFPHKSSWADSDMRVFLQRFASAAFTADQQAQIAATTVNGAANPIYGTADNSSASDQVFLLSAAEIEQYFANDLDRMAPCTEYALYQHGNPPDSGLRHMEMGTSYWWTRTPGVFDNGSAYVHYTGSVRYDGMMRGNTICGIRPAMWVDASAVEVVQDGVSGFVTRLYQVCLNRAPDPAGKADWVGKLKNGARTGVTAAYGFIFSNEFKGKNLCNEDFVKQLYQAFMGREYDAAGLKDWVNRLNTGKTREYVFNGFAMSTEFRKICESYGIQQGEAIAIPQYGTVPTGTCSVCGKEDGVTGFVKRMYKVALGREGDPSGLKDWTNRLWTHAASGRDIAYGFIFSKEFLGKNYSDADYVEHLYEAFMGRKSDAPGKADWVGRLAKGSSREDVFNGFVGSQEFSGICNSYGIVRG